jgi:hypothetical protein
MECRRKLQKAAKKKKSFPEKNHKNAHQRTSSLSNLLQQNLSADFRHKKWL